MKLSGSSVLVSGAAAGLGAATARHLHGAGAHVVAFDLDAEGAKAVATALGPKADWSAGDATDEVAVNAALDTALELAPLRGVVACAGGASASHRTLGRDGVPHDYDAFAAIVAMNVFTTFNTLRLAARVMAGNDPDEDGERGAIVLTSSLAAFEGQIGQLAYSAAKGAINSMTLTAARDLAVVGIRVNTIAPGTIATERWDLAPAGMRENLEKKVPFPPRFGRPDEFAALAEHLLTNGYLNGQITRLDGAIRFDPR
jgi:NAD(P)-dependent dehydrogenase (short-subunit alcohol dehydrogenase family)